jgi:hypothetical protein
MGGGGSKYFSDLFQPQFSEYSLIFNTLHNSTIPGPPLGMLARLSWLFFGPSTACVVDVSSRNGWINLIAIGSKVYVR